MKKLLASVLLLTLIFLCGCSAAVGDDVETLKNWSFQYNEETNDYSVFFAFLNKKGEFTSADVDMDIRIVDEDGNELYASTRTVTKEDFSYYTSQAAGEQYLANVRIKASDISEGTSASGTVYFVIHKENVIWFDEVSCKALYCLPVKEVTVQAEPLPTELQVKGFDGNTQSVIQIDDISWDFIGSVLPKLKVILSGVKTYSNDDLTHKLPSDTISYKLYDSNGYMVKSGNVYLDSLDAGDKFRDDSIVVYDVKPREAYTLKLMEYEW